MLLLRVSFVLLLCANGLIAARALGYLGNASGGEARRLEQQVAPESVRVVGVGERPRLTAGAPGSELGRKEGDKEEKGQRHQQGGEQACQRWADLVEADAAQLERLLSQSFPSVAVARRTNTEVVGYWVFIPPLATRDEAKRKVAEIEQLGEQEFFIVQAAGPNQFAVSLGTYRTEAAANTRLEALRAKGVKSARVGERRGKALHTLEVRGLREQAEVVRQAVSGLLPKAVSSACIEEQGAAM